LLALLPFAIFLVEPKSKHQVLIQNKNDGSYLCATDCSSVEWTHDQPQLWDIVKSKNDFLIKNKKHKSYLCLINDQIILCFSESIAKRFTELELNTLGTPGIRFVYCFNNDFNYMKDVYLN
jgi:hypothetical protein